jgi:hypothetical protein
MPDETEILEPMNDCLSPDFQSKLDPYFTSEAPVKVREYSNWVRKGAL